LINIGAMLPKHNAKGVLVIFLKKYRPIRVPNKTALGYQNHIVSAKATPPQSCKSISTKTGRNINNKGIMNEGKIMLVKGVFFVKSNFSNLFAQKQKDRKANKRQNPDREEISGTTEYINIIIEAILNKILK
jgi:hypothetical protein